MRELWLAILLGTASSLPSAGGNEIKREATAHFQRAEAALAAGEPGFGRADAERALSLSERAGDPSAQAAALSLLGSAELAEGRTEGLFSFLSEALTRAARAQDDFAIAALAATLGRLAPDVDRTDQAEGLLAQALDALSRLRQGNRRVRWFEIHHAALGLPAPVEWTGDTRHRLGDRDLDTALGVVLHYRGSFRMWAAGRFDEARTDLLAALENLPADHTHRDLVAVDLGAVEARAQQFEPAYARLLAAVEGLRGRCCTPQVLSGLELALWLLADIDDDRGRFEEALRWNAQGIELARGQRNLTGETELLVKKSRIEQHAGHVEASLKTLETARDTAKASGDQVVIDRVARAFAIRNIAAGRLEEASKVLAAPVSEAGSQDRCTAGYSRLLLVASYALANRPRDAAAAWQTYSDQAADSFCPEVDFFARLVRAVIMTGELGSGGELVTEIGDPSKGLLLRPEGLEILGVLQSATKGRPLRDLLSAELEPRLRRAQERRDATAERKFRLLRGEMLLELGDFTAARDDMTWLTESARLADDRATQISAAWLGSRIARKLGRTDEAIRHLEEALALEEASLAELTLDEFLLAGAGGAALQYETLVELLLDSGRSEEAFTAAERSRSLALVRLLAGAPAATPSSPGDHEARREVERLRVERRAIADRQARGEIDAQSFAAESSRLNARFDEATLRLKLTRHREALGPPLTPPTVADVRRSLPAETTLVSFFVLPKETIVWVLDAERLTTQRLALGRDELATLVAGFRERIATRRPLPRRGAEAIRSHEADSTAGDALSARLWAPLVPLVRHRRVILEPHDALHALPFAALRGPNGRFLIEDFVPSTLPSAATLQFFRLPRPLAPGAPLVVGDPAVPPGWTLPRLAGAHAEATRLGQRLGTTPPLGTGATETAIRARASAAGLIHIAAHFVRLENEPRYSHLALAPDADNDGKLEVHEIFDELELPATRLVVLSACETALGRRTEGDEIEGAVRGLLDAGSAAVLATHWAIDDEVSTTLMDRFYQRLLAGEPGAEALRNAQLETLEEHPAPHFWAAFTLAGDPGVSLAER